MNAQEFISNCRKLIGTPYSECDCIGVIRKAAGISCAGTNWLWRSINNSAKYRYLTQRCSPPAASLLDGELVFKISNGIPSGYEDEPNCYHVGVYVGGNRVLHSSPSTGVREAEYNPSEWQGSGLLKQVEYSSGESGGAEIGNFPDSYNALVDKLSEIVKELEAIINDLQ